MKKIIILALIGFTAWNYYSKNSGTTHNSVSVPAAVAEQRSDTFYQQPTSNFRCDGREHCSQMTSRAEAVFFINNCPNTKMDGDRDGVPCENDSRF
ncbi:excalibur calcium-binding domain-containing protein [Amphritea sp. HPY]|uniref:excalibur calcium-binding domain-containing protein n=1 Tax=Amphritea sp. HPY TaxID=3421652 RepID=UPI003D7CB1D0